MESTPKKRTLNQDEIPRITYKWVFFRRDTFRIFNMGESFPKTMPYYLSDELASKPYNHNLR